MESNSTGRMEVFGKALATEGLRVVFGTDAVAGAHGQNIREAVARVEQGGQPPGDLIVSLTSLAAESLGLGDEIGTVAEGYAPIWWWWTVTRQRMSGRWATCGW